MENKSRRRFIVALTTSAIAGCSGTTDQSAKTNSSATPTPTPTPELCDHPYESDGEQVSYQYSQAYEQLNSITSVIGDPKTVEQAQESVFGGGSALYKLQCDTSPCESSFYDAIEAFRAVQNQAQTTRDDFNAVESMAKSCDIELTDYVTSATNSGAKVASHLKTAAEEFEQSAQNQIDNDNTTFQTDSAFEAGMSTYEQAEAIDVPSATSVDNRLTVYSGETAE
ncbi:hypothetical protein NDI56_15890 [Haloarcula sp. S1CR25-12]|uniref:Lipoprotein n=1 Tax=Haloarcula saliterrae TaxID=2950534 RepID=A0ABU2FF72_9EURY|nr:hypothetical protein [Haloarcula sp. S1CR25-12]MDS0260887.1 hypothetical protein [Haloarcula sp. S1CR25-12]